MKRVFAIFLVICMMLPLCLGAEASSLQYNYSTSANSGVRDETCTTLEGTRVDSYYTGSYTYDKLEDLSSGNLKIALRELMTSTHSKQTSYNNCRDYAVKTDCENGDGRTINLLYCGYSAVRSDYVNDRSGGWNREHVWPKSLGGFNQEAAGADLHHIRPSDSGINSTRGNLKYGNVSGGNTVKGASYTGSAVGGWSSGSYFEPLDNVKGDVARICLYVYVRWGKQYPQCDNINRVFQSIDVLLEWCALDPVDTWEMGRNEVVAKIQGNRNVFIDYPELAWQLFDREMPEGMVTPSSGSTGSSTTKPTEPAPTEPEETKPAACTHEKTVIRDVVEATCGKHGYTGDTYCKACGKLLKKGSATDVTNDHSYGEWIVIEEPTASVDGLRERDCGVCGYRESETIPALGTPQTEAKPTTPAPTEPAPTKPLATVAPTQPTQQGGEEAGSFRWIIIVLVAVAAVCVIIVIPKGKRKDS